MEKISLRARVVQAIAPQEKGGKERRRFGNRYPGRGS
jgi:hypothetical protein